MPLATNTDLNFPSGGAGYTFDPLEVEFPGGARTVSGFSGWTTIETPFVDGDVLAALNSVRFLAAEGVGYYYRVLVSFDGGASWKRFAAGEWVSSSASVVTTEGMSLADAEDVRRWPSDSDVTDIGFLIAIRRDTGSTPRGLITGIEILHGTDTPTLPGEPASDGALDDGTEERRLFRPDFPVSIDWVSGVEQVRMLSGHTVRIPRQSESRMIARVSWSGRATPEKEALVTWLRSHVTQGFLWQPPQLDEPVTWSVVDDIGETLQSATATVGVWKIEALFVQSLGVTEQLVTPDWLLIANPVGDSLYHIVDNDTLLVTETFGEAPVPIARLAADSTGVHWLIRANSSGATLCYWDGGVASVGAALDNYDPIDEAHSVAGVAVMAGTGCLALTGGSTTRFWTADKDGRSSVAIDHTGFVRPQGLTWVSGGTSLAFMLMEDGTQRAAVAKIDTSGAMASGYPAVIPGEFGGNDLDSFWQCANIQRVAGGNVWVFLGPNGIDGDIVPGIYEMALPDGGPGTPSLVFSLASATPIHRVAFAVDEDGNAFVVVAYEGSVAETRFYSWDGATLTFRGDHTDLGGIAGIETRRPSVWRSIDGWFVGVYDNVNGLSGVARFALDGSFVEVVTDQADSTELHFQELTPMTNADPAAYWIQRVADA